MVEKLEREQGTHVIREGYGEVYAMATTTRKADEIVRAVNHQRENEKAIKAQDLEPVSCAYCECAGFATRAPISSDESLTWARRLSAIRLGHIATHHPEEWEASAVEWDMQAYGRERNRLRIEEQARHVANCAYQGHGLRAPRVGGVEVRWQYSGDGVYCQACNGKIDFEQLKSLDIPGVHIADGKLMLSVPGSKS